MKTPATDFDEDGLDFETADFEINDPELDLQNGGLKLDAQVDAQDFEFEKIENESDPGPASVSADPDMADIEISFAQNDDTDADLELEELSLDMDDPVAEESSIDDLELDDLELDDLELDDLELDTEKDEVPELEFDDDRQADLTIEDNDDNRDSSPDPEEALIHVPTQPQDYIIQDKPDMRENDIELESDVSEQPEDQEADEEIQQTAAEQDKFAEYDKVLEQETEPQDAGITIPDPEVEDNTYPSESLLAPTDDEIETTTKISMDQEALITSLSAQNIRQKRSAKKKKGISLPVKILLVLVLLILAAYVAIIRLGVTIPVMSDIQIPFITEWLAPKQAPQPTLDPIPDEPSIDGRFVSNKSAGDLFIVTGRIKNPSNIAVSYIQVKGTLMTKDNTKAKTLIAYCGNIISEETLKSGNISDITKQMGVRQGNQNTNVNIRPGASVMFMLVFSNLPQDLTNFTVAVQGFEPTQK